MEKNYIQTRNVSWLNTPKDTIWIPNFDDYITPEDPKLRETPFGVSLQLLECGPDEDLFQLQK